VDFTTEVQEPDARVLRLTGVELGGRSLAGIAGSNPAGDLDVCCECCVLSGRGLCDSPIPRPEEYYLLYVCVTECDQVQQQPSASTVSR
jgi:hypothetical protein